MNKTTIALAQKQAKEILESFYQINSADEHNKGTNPYISRQYTRKCAVKFVDGILDEYDIIRSMCYDYDITTWDERADYWEMVKKFI
tara:strand:+ start:221747 stop:222007 length:261 start_codon:yes stop_codon:yes gene_type:complete